MHVVLAAASDTVDKTSTAYGIGHALGSLALVVLLVAGVLALMRRRRG